jgi:putative phosphoribosyl transferase
MANEPTRFADRSDAGRHLAARLTGMNLIRPIVFALPRGGVPVALEVARVLNAPLELLLVRKIGAPGAPELALGAIVDGQDPQTIINDDVRRSSGADAVFIDHARRRALAEIERRRTLYRQDRPPIDPAGCAAVIVDDGLATGATAKAALAAIKRRGAASTMLAVPVAPVSALDDMQSHADQIVCLYAAVRFHSVGAFYEDFHQLTDEETIRLLRQIPAPRPDTA